MGRPPKKRLTRGFGKFGGGPYELPKTGPSTYWQIIQHFYYVQSLNQEESFYSIILRIQEDLKEIWGSVNPRLPLFWTVA